MTIDTGMLDRLERAAMAYERLGKLTRDDEKTRAIRKEAMAELAASRAAIITAATPNRITFQNGPSMAQVTYAEFLTWIYERLEHVHGENPNVDYMHRLRELAASVVPADADSPGSTDPVTPEMLAAGWQVLKRNRWPSLGPGPGLIEAYQAMRALEKHKKPAAGEGSG